MKKFFLPIMAAVCMVGLTACGNTDSADNSAASASAEKSAAEQSVGAEKSAENSETEQTADDAAAAGQAEENSPETNAENDSDKDTIVVYFSATGTTKGVAERIASVTDADIFEISAAEPYSDADLDWNDKNSRTTLEMNDPDVRPAIANDTVDLDGYETVYIGYPIWWGEAPRIMSTFVEAHDFDGKTVIPFCTSGGSSIGRSGENLASQAGGGNWLAGGRLDANISESELQDWINDMN
ncbi:MAG: flavodoxin [Ruminococcus sp.]|uniref:flavodoxin n=1 Tax=Ruminococcus sp. TaxID=41978 RepID=UPI0025E9CA92|nr:flavodoxin [Ruminococcus sp.]MBR0528501.1 flavodoxin [Ruminococcus sp.]